MKLIQDNIKKGSAKVKIETTDDLWYLSNLIDTGDLIKGKTLRKIKTTTKEERSGKVTKKPVFMEIKVEKVDFSKSASTLKVLGPITQGPEDIPKGTHHSFNLEENTIFTIIKEQWLQYQIEKIKEACQETTSNILICVLDREEAIFATLKKYGFSILSHLKGTVAKKR